MVVEAIEHVQLAMPAGGESDAIAFYDELLGVPNVPKPASLAGRGGCWFEDGEVKIHLGVDAEFRPARKAHPALVVTDLPAMIERLSHAGVETEPGAPIEGFERVFIADPFGNRIELMMRSDPSAP